MEFLAYVFVFGIITSVVANSRGRNAVGWFFAGCAMFILAIPILLVLPRLDGQTCPHCKTAGLPLGATVCRACQRDLRSHNGGAL